MKYFQLSYIRGGGGGGGDRGVSKHLPPLVPPFLPPVPFCELSPAFRLFSTNLAMLLYKAVLSNFLMTDVTPMPFEEPKYLR